MRTFYLGRVIPDEYALYLEGNGIAHVAVGSSGTAPDGIAGGWVRMDPGPGNVWLEKQPPEIFLLHVFGHTTTWAEMARDFAKRQDCEDMYVVADLLKQLNTELLAARAEYLKMRK